MTNAEACRRIRAKWKAQGLCSVCGQRKPPEGRVTCKVCSTRPNAKNMKRLRERRESKGICTRCGQEVSAPGHSLCSNCLDYQARWRGEKKRD